MHPITKISARAKKSPEPARRQIDLADEYAELVADERDPARRRRSLLSSLLYGLSSGDAEPVAAMLGALDLRANSLAQALCDEPSDHSGAAVMLHYGIEAAADVHRAAEAYRRERAFVVLDVLDRLTDAVPPDMKAALIEARTAVREMAGFGPRPAPADGEHQTQ